MRENCVWMPTAKTSTGELKESKLFKDLLSFTQKNRRQAVKLYGILKSDDFKKVYGKKVQFDDTNEPLLASVINNTSIKGVLDETIVADTLTKKIGGYNSDNERLTLEDTTANYRDLSAKTIEFNNNSPYKDKYVAVVNKQKDGKIFLNVERINDTNSILAKNIAASYALNNKIRTILGNYGVSIEALNSLQDRLGESGVVDYENARVTADGLISLIKLAEGSRGEAVLPEEFAHFILDVMSDNVMISRLINLCNQDEVAQYALGDDYEAYKKDYGGDSSRLAREAAGKLVSRMFLQNEETPAQYKTFFDRLLTSIKNFFSNIFSPSEISRAIVESDHLAGQIANIILVEDNVKKIELDKLPKLSSLKHLEKSASRAAEILNANMNNIAKEFSFYSEKLEYQIKKASTEEEKKALTKKLADYQTKVRDYLGQQSINMATEQYSYGVEKFIEYGAHDISNIVEKLKEVINFEGIPNDARAKILENCKNIIASNKSVLQMIQESILDESSDVVLSDEAKERLDIFSSNLAKAEQSLYSQAVITFKDFIEEFLPEEGITITSNSTTKKITRDDLTQLLRTADRDISILDTWVQSTAEAGDIVLKLADQAMKAAQDRKRTRVLKIKRELLALAQELKSQGITDTDWMFERHSDGTLSSNYISYINWTRYKDEEARIKEEATSEEKKAWYKANWDFDNNRPNAKYGVNIDSIFPKDSIKRKYYDYFMELRGELISILPSSLYEDAPTKAIQITKDLWERIKSSSPDSWLGQVWKDTKSQLISKPDDTEFGAKANFKGEEMLGIPIFFVNNVENEQDLSRDTVSTMLAFADMAINYDEMNQVMDYFEVGRTVMENREANILKKGKPVEEKLNELGVQVSRKLTGGASNIAARYNEFLRSQLYHRYMKDGVLVEGENWEIKANKAATLLNKVSSLNQLALNSLAGIAAVGNDMINVNSEALAGQYFTPKNLKDADAIYLKELAGVLGEAGNPIKSNKLSLFIEKFDVLHEYEDEIRDIEWDKSKIKKFMSSNSLYIFMHMGSHWGETRTALAQAQKIKIKSDDGTKEESLWDVLERKWIDENDHSKGAELVAKEGYTLDTATVTKYSRKFMGLNERLFGIYNQADRNALQSTAVGQLVFLYRKFMVPAINRRFGKANYNLDLAEETEGYYLSFYHFMANLATDSRNLGRSIKMYWNDMSSNERANCVRAINELGAFVSLAVVAAVLAHADWEDKNNPWHKRFLAYMTKRMKTEAGAFTPVGIFGEMWNIVKSPAAGINTLEGMADVLGVLNPWNYETIGGDSAVVQSGRYKGHNKAYKKFMNSPFVPTNKTIYKLFHPEESIVAFN